VVVLHKVQSLQLGQFSHSRKSLSDLFKSFLEDDDQLCHGIFLLLLVPTG
jgi:hypothetical protein